MKILQFTPSQRPRPDLPELALGGAVLSWPKANRVTIDIDRCTRGSAWEWVEDGTVFMQLPPFAQWTRETVDTLFARAMGELPEEERLKAFVTYNPDDFEQVQTIDSGRRHLILFTLYDDECKMLTPEVRRYFYERYGRPAVKQRAAQQGPKGAR